MGQKSTGEKATDRKAKGEEEVWEYVEFLKSDIK